ncbi:hypothetical protein J6590_050600 [Homalodisca vitripennis]|nr:hypothetical protein J6590_050600 [Homalodisca vitripennis]
MDAVVVSGPGSSNTGKKSREARHHWTTVDLYCCCEYLRLAHDAMDVVCQAVQIRKGREAVEPPVTTTGLLQTLYYCCEYLRLAHDAMDAVVVSGPGSSNTGKGSRPESRPSPPLDYCRPCTAAVNI